MTDEDLSGMLGEIVANTHILDAKLNALRDLLVAKGLFTREEYLAAVKSSMKQHDEEQERDLQELAWQELLKDRPKQ